MNNDIFDKESCHVRLDHYFIHLGCYLPYWIKFLFSKPFNKPNQVKDLDLLDQVKLMLDVQADASDEIIIDKCKKFIHLHKIIENTRARRRLENGHHVLLQSIYLSFYVLFYVIISVFQ